MKVNQQWKRSGALWPICSQGYRRKILFEHRCIFYLLMQSQ